jgi:hypothetical protein
MSILAVVGNEQDARVLRDRDVATIVATDKQTAQQITAAITPSTKGIISIGVAGSLAPQLHNGDVVVGYCVWSGNEWLEADPEWTQQLLRLLPGPIAGPIAGMDWVLSDPKDKSQPAGADETMEARVAFWYRKTHAHAMNFDSHVAARVAHEHNLPFAVLQTVLVFPGGIIPPVFAVSLRRDGSFKVGSIARSLIVAPWQIGWFFCRLKELKAANAALLRCLERLGPRLGCPYLVQLVLDMA